MTEPIIGINIEDNHISIGLVDIESRKILSNTVQRKRVNPSGSAEQIIATWTTALKEVAQNCENIGIGLPGLCDYVTGTMLMNDAGRYNGLYQQSLKKIFAGIIGTSTDNVKIMNDAVCFLQGEVFGGSGRGFKSSIGITLGIGLGTAKYQNGVVTDELLQNVDISGHRAEDLISIRWLLQRFKGLSGIYANDLMEMKQHEANPYFQQVFDEFARNLASFIILFIRQSSPEVVVIGGFMETCNRYFFDSVTSLLVAEGIKVPILRATLGEQASIIGAASSWYSEAQIHA
ncbi:MAG TPA: ROK family protein [Pedobacter sp.]|jgi:glucokinase